MPVRGKARQTLKGPDLLRPGPRQDPGPQQAVSYADRRVLTTGSDPVLTEIGAAHTNRALTGSLIPNGLGPTEGAAALCAVRTGAPDQPT